MTTSRTRIIVARVLAVIADGIQLGFMPFFFEGAASPVNDILDVVIGIAMVALVGWHWAFLPTFAAELIPFADLAPTWTVAVLVATRHRASAPAQTSTPTTPPAAHEGAPKALLGTPSSSSGQKPAV